MNYNAIGEIAGWVYYRTKSLLHTIWAKTRKIAQFLILGAVIVLAIPPIVQYWLSRVRIPQVPISAIVAMGVATILLLTFSASMYMVVHVIRSIVITESASPGMRNRRRQPSTDGAYIPTDDGKLWEAEQMDILKRKGVLHETDIEDLASEIGHREILKNRGKEA